MLNANGTILKKIYDSFSVKFCLGKYIFSLYISWTQRTFITCLFVCYLWLSIDWLIDFCHRVIWYQTFQSKINKFQTNLFDSNLVGWGCRIHRRHLFRGVILPTQWVSWYMTSRNQMVKLQSWNFEEYWEPLHCHLSQVHSDPQWHHLIGSDQWVK